MAGYRKAKRYKEKKINKKKLLTCLLLAVVIIATIYLAVSNKLLDLFKEKEKTPEEQPVVEVQETEETEEPEEVEEDKDEEVDVSDIPDKMGGYNVIGKLVIDKIGVNKNIIGVYTKDSLDLSVTSLVKGPVINESGNLCLSGHNYNNMLARLPELQEGDTFYIIAKDKKTKVNYQIYKMYTCFPKDLSCLDQNTKNGLREVTLITCTKGAVTRLICKAREI